MVDFSPSGELTEGPVIWFELEGKNNVGLLDEKAAEDLDAAIKSNAPDPVGVMVKYGEKDDSCRITELYTISGLGLGSTNTARGECKRQKTDPTQEVVTFVQRNLWNEKQTTNERPWRRVRYVKGEELTVTRVLRMENGEYNEIAVVEVEETAQKKEMYVRKTKSSWREISCHADFGKGPVGVVIENERLDLLMAPGHCDLGVFLEAQHMAVQASMEDVIGMAVKCLLSSLQNWGDLELSHKDIKLHNLIVFPDGNVGVIDFELMGPQGELVREPQTTGTNAHPGQLKPDSEINGIDTWSVAVIFLELAFRTPMYKLGKKYSALFECAETQELINEIKTNTVTTYTAFANSGARYTEWVVFMMCVVLPYIQRETVIMWMHEVLKLDKEIVDAFCALVPPPEPFAYRQLIPKLNLDAATAAEVDQVFMRAFDPKSYAIDLIRSGINDDGEKEEKVKEIARGMSELTPSRQAQLYDRLCVHTHRDRFVNNASSVCNAYSTLDELKKIDSIDIMFLIAEGI